MIVEELVATAPLMTEFRLSEYSKLSKQILKTLKTHRDFVQREFTRHGGRIAIDISQDHNLWLELHSLVQDVENSRKVCARLGIYDSSANANSVFKTTPVHSGLKLILKH